MGVSFKIFWKIMIRYKYDERNSHFFYLAFPLLVNNKKNLQSPTFHKVTLFLMFFFMIQSGKNVGKIMQSYSNVKVTVTSPEAIACNHDDIMNKLFSNTGNFRSKFSIWKKKLKM